MTRAEFAKLIDKECEYSTKSHNFGDCRVISGEDFVVLYDDTKSPALEIARWRKECIATYLDYLKNPSKYNNAPFETYEKIDNEKAMLANILSFISIKEEV